MLVSENHTPRPLYPGGRNPVTTEQEKGREEVRAKAGVDVSEKKKDSREFNRESSSP